MVFSVSVLLLVLAAFSSLILADPTTTPPLSTAQFNRPTDQSAIENGIAIGGVDEDGRMTTSESSESSTGPPKTSTEQTTIPPTRPSDQEAIENGIAIGDFSRKKGRKNAGKSLAPLPFSEAQIRDILQYGTLDKYLCQLTAHLLVPLQSANGALHRLIGIVRPNSSSNGITANTGLLGWISLFLLRDSYYLQTKLINEYANHFAHSQLVGKITNDDCSRRLICTAISLVEDTLAEVVQVSRSLPALKRGVAHLKQARQTLKRIVYTKESTICSIGSSHVLKPNYKPQGAIASGSGSGQLYGQQQQQQQYLIQPEQSVVYENQPGNLLPFNVGQEEPTENRPYPVRPLKKPQVYQNPFGLRPQSVANNNNKAFNYGK